MDSIAPNLFVADMATSIEFYERLGFTRTMSVPEAAPFVWAMLTNGRVSVMLQTMESLADELPPISRAGGGSLLLYINLHNIQAYFKRLEQAVPILKGLEKTFYGATEFSVADPDGFVITFAEHEAG
ncbi:VOC family protein [Deminuibacter soli]|uniref:Glyoxalase n=1 Tax=Deminuibacter soli TaxID=2291815 RepID=A0A3E1NMJ6_9BACT|nr:VOC family protein [Deminuibacter soli]RFM29143.1 glyoxalase [Deminuibacter soli]